MKKEKDYAYIVAFFFFNRSGLKFFHLNKNLKPLPNLIKMTASDFNNFAEISLATYNLEAFDIDRQTALNAIVKEIEESLLDLNKQTTKDARYKNLKVKNATPEDYTERIIEIEKGKIIITGIRHANGNTAMPFVNIWTNFYTSEAELKEIYNFFLFDYFKVFEPKEIRYFTKNLIPSNTISSCYLVQKSSEIKNIKPHPEEQDMKLISPADTTYYDWYVTGYKNFHAQFPTLENSVPLNSLAVMEESNAAGLLKLAIYKGKEIGLIAATREAFLGMDGLYFLEIFMDENYKGKGLAKSIQRKFVAEFSQDEDFIWGTVDYHNKPSFKTALSNKRLAIRFENCIAL